MEHESFEDNEIAEILNNQFVPIKVDKEERPDIDSVYMSVCQAVNGQGGWPLTIIMTSEQKPFFAGTYFPKKPRYNMPGLLTILSTVAKKWKDNKNELLESGNEITESMNKNDITTNGELSKNTINKAVKLYKQSFDDVYGGFGSNPKFPAPHNLMFLMRFFKIENFNASLQMVEKTLQQMYRGGIFDHIGFGFSRYSTDEKWLVPHFEKMLYDNALLISAYLDAYQITKNDLYKKIAVKTIDYVFRELTDKDGGFYCAQDADSEGVEGKYYVFTPEETIKILGEKDGNYFNEYFGITAKGNFEGKNIPNLLYNKNYNKTNERIDQLSEKVYEYRKNRTHLHKDDKILTSWNALMIVALAKAYKILNYVKYLNAAQRAIRFIEEKLSDKDQNLYVRYRDGETSGNGHIDDYSYTVWALIELYEATFNLEYLNKALLLNEKQIQNFFDYDNGGFYLYGSKSESLILRPKELYDGATPSGNSVSAYNLLKLSKMSENSKLDEIAFKQLNFINSNIQNYPSGYSFALMAFMQVLYPSKEIICVLDNEEDFITFKNIIHSMFIPNVTVLVKNLRKSNEQDFLKSYGLLDGKTTYYVCENNTCSYPINDINELLQKLENLRYSQ